MPATIGLDLVDTRIFPDPDPALKPFEITIPEWDDVIHIVPERFRPEAERRARKRRLINRLKNSPTPEIVQRVGQIMGVVDDVEDMVSTALVLAKPLILKLGPRAIPIVGWILTARDIAEAFLAVSSVIPRGRAGKNRFTDFLHNTSLRSGARLRRTNRYLRSRPGAGAVLEGLQSLDTLTGVGLSLGPIMGTSEDVLFGIIAALRGQRGKVRLPDPTTPAGIAAYVITFLPIALLIAPFLETVLIASLLVAWMLAIGYFVGHLPAPVAESRWQRHKSAKVPQVLPRREETRELLLEAGIDPDRDEPPPLPFVQTEPTFEDLSLAVQQHWRSFLFNAKMSFGTSVEGTFLVTGLISHTKDLFDYLEGEPGNLYFSPNMGDMAQMRFLETQLRIQRRVITAPTG